jgi:PKD repeat protein
MKKLLPILIATLMFAGQAAAQTITVHVSGTVTRDSTGAPVNDHQVIIQADSNSYGFTFYATRITNNNGFWDCTIHDVPATGAAVYFNVSTKDCDSSVLVKTFVGTTLADTVNFVICIGTVVTCEADFISDLDPVHSGLVDFNDTSTPVGSVVSWEWGFGDPASGSANVSTLQNPTHFYPGPGTYEVCLHIATAGGCTSSKCEEVVIEQQTGCEASYQYYADSTNSLHLHFYDVSSAAGTIISRYWTFGDGGTATTYDPWHIYASTGIYNVCLTIVTSDSCTSTYCDNVHVSSTTTNCESWITQSADYLTVHFEGHTHSPYPTTYTWYMGDPDSTTMTGPSVTFTYPAAGNYTVTIVSMDSTGCQFSNTKGISVTDVTHVYGYVVAGTMPVDHGLIELIKSEGGALTVVDTKEFGDSAGLYLFENVAQGHYYIRASLLPSSAQYGQYVPTYYISAMNWSDANLVELGEPTNPYNIEMVHAISYGAGSGTISGTISTNTKMNDSGTPAPDVEVLLLNSSNEPLAFTVTDQNGQFSFQNMAFGDYTIYPEIIGKTTIPTLVTLDNAHASVATSFTIQGSNIAGIRDVMPAFVTSISEVFPTPSTEKAHLTILAVRNTEITVSVYFITGQLAGESLFTLNPGTNRITVPVKDLSSGLYYLSIKDGQGVSVIRKMVIRK